MPRGQGGLILRVWGHRALGTSGYRLRGDFGDAAGGPARADAATWDYDGAPATVYWRGVGRVAGEAGDVFGAAWAFG